MTCTKFLLLASALAMPGAPAFAQDNQPQEAQTDDNQAPAQTQAAGRAQAYGEIVVTAQKREESVQDVPATVVALSGEDLVKRGIVDITDLAKSVPSLKVTTLRQRANIYIRGVGQTLSAANGDPAIAANLNGAYVPSIMLGSAIFDIERVEVLPGPQGTLYGRNAAGGVVNYISRRPGSDFGADGFLEYGNYDRIHAFAGVDVPVSDALKTRVAVNFVRHDGYYDNGANDQDTKAARLTTEWTPSDRTRVFAALTYDKEDGSGTANQVNPPPADPWELPFDADAEGLFTDAETWIGNIEYDQDLSDALTLTYIGGYNSIDSTGKLHVLLGTPLAFSTSDTQLESFSNELRVNGDWGDWNGVLGLYQYSSDVNVRDSLLRGPAVITTGPYEQNADGYAIFGQVTYSPVPALRLTGGLRYSRDKKEFGGENSTTIGGNVVTRIPYQGDKSWNRLDWKGGLEYDASDHTMLYASVQTGFNQGGFSTAPATLVGNNASVFKPMSLVAYTIGAKNEFLSGDVIVNVEGFYYDYKDYQVSSRSPVTALNEVYNAEKTTIYGVEIQSSVRPSSQDNLGFGLTLLDGHFDRLRVPASPAPLVFDGYDVPYAPHITLNANYTHYFDLANGATIEPFAQVSYTSEQWSKFDHANGTLIDEYIIVDANLTYRSPDERWSLALWGRNLTDTFSYALLLGPAVPGPGVGIPRPPRTYGVRAGFKF